MWTDKQIKDAVGDYYGNLDHPHVPDLKVKDYPAFQRAAGLLFDTQEPSHDQVAQVHQHLQGAGVSPAEFEHVWMVAKPVANRLLGRDPSMIDVGLLKGATPKGIHQHYTDHPYPGYEEVTAGQVAKAWRQAEPIAQRNGLTAPNLHEVTRFAAAGYSAEDMQQHYGSG